MAVHLTTFLAAVCERSGAHQCDSYNAAVISSLAFLAIAVVVVVLFFALRVAPVNRSRRAAGLPKLPWRTIAGSRMRRDVLADPNAARALDDEKESRRQMAWEEEQASHELIRLGSHISRTHCRTHDRWCLHADEDGHPPGGNENPRAPADWPPDLRNAVKKR